MTSLIIIYTVSIAFLFTLYSGILVYLSVNGNQRKPMEILSFYISTTLLAPIILFFLPLVVYMLIPLAQKSTQKKREELGKDFEDYFKD